MAPTATGTGVVHWGSQRGCGGIQAVPRWHVPLTGGFPESQPRHIHTLVWLQLPSGEPDSANPSHVPTFCCGWGDQREVILHTVFSGQGIPRHMMSNQKYYPSLPVEMTGTVTLSVACTIVHAQRSDAQWFRGFAVQIVELARSCTCCQGLSSTIQLGRLPTRQFITRI